MQTEQSTYISIIPTFNSPDSSMQKNAAAYTEVGPYLFGSLVTPMAPHSIKDPIQNHLATLFQVSQTVDHFTLQTKHLDPSPVNTESSKVKHMISVCRIWALVLPTEISEVLLY